MKIAVLGNGVEGQSIAKYFGDKGDEVEIFDEKNEGVDFGQMDFSEFDKVFRSPSVPPSKIRSDKLTSATKYFFEWCPADIIGVTGTKGKGTTCSLIASILEAAGLKVWLIGNIGVPALDVLDKIGPRDIVVYEMSSFQLWDMTKSPKVAVIVHMEADHLDVHEGMDDYIDAKSNIVRYQREGNVTIYDETNEISTQIAMLSLGRKVAYPTGKLEEILDNLVIPGKHNRMNGEAAIRAALAVGVKNKEIIGQGLKNFTGLPHRLKCVREVNEVKYYDDSISTTPGSAIAAIRSFAGPKILILGGSDKGSEYDELAQAVANGGVKKVILVGPEGEKIQRALINADYEKVIRVNKVPYDMAEVVKIATAIAEVGNVVVLSPACASFDSFENYSDRGDQFIAAVEAI
jgi:UDP-N-acetylmuramoylalanine--D-glutamate ligase